MKSIRIFLVVVIITSITLITFITLLHGYRQSMRKAQSLFDDQLMQQAELLNAFPYTKGSDNNVTAPVVIKFTATSDRDVHTLAYQVFTGNLTLIARSENIPEKPIRDFQESYADVDFNGYRWRTLVLHNPTNGNWTMIAGREDVRNDLAESVVLESVVPFAAALPLAGLLIWLIISFGLKPISNLALQLKSRGVTDFSPILQDSVPRELMLLSASANDLLKRLEASFEREKRFNSDVAHELRTPIAALKVHLQNMVDEYQQHSPEAVTRLKNGVDRMSYLVEQILMLNRMDPDHYKGQFTRLELQGIVKQVIEQMIDGINDKHLLIEFQGDTGEIYGDAFALETLVRNLLDNAVKYTPSNGKITIRITDTVDSCMFQIMDSGPGIPADQYDRVLERFYRVGGDRHSSRVIGCGLGLSIVRHITRLHQAQLTLGPADLGGLAVTVVFHSLNKSNPDNIKYIAYPDRKTLT